MMFTQLEISLSDSNLGVNCGFVCSAVGLFLWNDV